MTLVKEKVLLSLWILGSLLFYCSLDSHSFAFILPHFPLRPFLLGALGLAFLCLFLKKPIRFPPNPFLIFAMPLGAVTIFFLIKFPIGTFSSLVFQDDFTSLYAASLRTLQALREGSLFGWDNRLLGGYYTISDINFNLGPFVGPFFALFGPPVGYHLFIFFLLLLFPILVYRLCRVLEEDRETSAMALWLSGFFAISFFRNILWWGNIDNLLGLDLFLLTLIALKRCQKHPKAFLGLSFFLILLAYAHLAYFLYALLVVGISQCFFPNRRGLLFTGLVGLLVFLAVLPYAIHFFHYPDFFRLDARHYHPSAIGLGESSAQSLEKLSWLARKGAWFTAGYEGVHGGNYGAAALLFAPLLLYTFWVEKRSRLAVASLFFILFVLPLKTVLGLALKRTYFLLPVLLSLTLAQSLKYFSKKGTLAPFVCVPALLLGTVGLPSGAPIPHQKTLASFFLGNFLQKDTHLDGHALFLETQGLWIETDTGERGERFPGPHVHTEMLLALETEKRFLSHGKDGYPFSIYRETCLISGIWKGKFLNTYDAETVNAFLKKWGVRYALVWSKAARSFFSAHSSSYEEIFYFDPWALFRFKEADPRSVVLPEGEGEIFDERYTHFAVRLKGVRKDEEAVVRINFFPGLRAFCEGKRVSLFSRDGQLAFKVPREGEAVVVFRYPRYASLYLLGLLAFFGGAIFFLKQR